MSMEILFKPIGIIRSPFKTLRGMPIQSGACRKIEGKIEVSPEFEDCLKDLEGFSHIYIIYHFHKVKRWKKYVIPFLDEEFRGVFSTRAPQRPNPIGLSVMEILSLEGSTIRVRNVDVLDGTPLLDIKPYIPQFKQVENPKIGWLSGKVQRFLETRSDERFIN